MTKGTITKAQFEAMFKLVYGAELTEEEKALAKAGAEGMSDWQTMSFSELDRLITEEEASRERGLT